MGFILQARRFGEDMRSYFVEILLPSPLGMKGIDIFV